MFITKMEIKLIPQKNMSTLESKVLILSVSTFNFLAITPSNTSVNIPKSNRDTIVYPEFSGLEKAIKAIIIPSNTLEYINMIGNFFMIQSLGF